MDRSAKQAVQNPSLEREVPLEEREAATRVDKLIGDSELDVVRQRMLEFAREYEATRANLKPGPERTSAMNAIVAKMRTLAIAARPCLDEFVKADDSAGTRLAAITILQLSPSLDHVSWLAGRMTEEQPFVFYHASLALLASVRAFGARDLERLKSSIEQCLKEVKSFRDGPPDRNTIEVLTQALSELTPTGSSRGASV